MKPILQCNPNIGHAQHLREVHARNVGVLGHVMPHRDLSCASDLRSPVFVRSNFAALATQEQVGQQHRRRLDWLMLATLSDFSFGHLKLREEVLVLRAFCQLLKPTRFTTWRLGCDVCRHVLALWPMLQAGRMHSACPQVDLVIGVFVVFLGGRGCDEWASGHRLHSYSGCLAGCRGLPRCLPFCGLHSNACLCDICAAGPLQGSFRDRKDCGVPLLRHGDHAVWTDGVWQRDSWGGHGLLFHARIQRALPACVRGLELLCG